MFRSSRSAHREAVGPGERTSGLIDRSDRLPLHGEDALDLLAQLSAGVVELPRGVFLGDDPEANLAALAQIGALDRVEVTGIGIKRDDRPDGQLQGAGSIRG